MSKWADIKVLSAASVVGLGGLALVAWLLLPLSAHVIPFLALTAVPLFTLFVVFYQAVVYHRQWLAMQDALGHARKQTEIAEMAFVLGTRACVCVHSVVIDTDTSRMFVRIENLGKVPADSIELWGFLDLSETWEPKIVPINRQYDVLFPGTMKINTRIALHDHFSVEQIATIMSGAGKLMFRGTVRYSDAFLPKDLRESPFAFRYRLGDKDWFVYSGEDEN